MKSGLNFIAAIVAAILVVLGATIFTVDQRKFAIVFQFGEVREVISEPGLYFKWPMIQNVRYFDKRILTLDNAEPERFITSEKKNVLVDSFVKWKIIDPQLYYVSVAGDEIRAKTRLSQTVNAGLREEFGKRTVHDVVSGERDLIMEQMRDKADQDARKIGVQIIAYRDAQKMKGEGDAKATATYAQAFGQNPEFYAFYRSLEAYRNSFNGKNDVIVVEPNSDFFKYMKSIGRGGEKTGK